ncbi:hypothetical protein [Desulfosporosinus metallidurans]|uniref:hypothetical protein n=1 Tax=Desulfosporosinus metallidurans TaxID=1888891 RepID=UPI001115082F|nr:hypothetical protein [Desulfosporosinus metallidurans]
MRKRCFLYFVQNMLQKSAARLAAANVHWMFHPLNNPPIERNICSDKQFRPHSICPGEERLARCGVKEGDFSSKY